MAAWTIGVDFGGTNTKIGLVDLHGRVARTQVFPSARMQGPRAFVRGVGQAIETLTHSAGIVPRQLRGVGIGAPGGVDVERGIVRSCVNVPGWRNVPLRALLERRLRCRCAVENDANLVALGEWRFGAGTRVPNLVCLTLGTGVGGGMIVDGALYHGASGAAAEVGHMVIDPRGRRCGCGVRGCLEAQVGTAAILAKARQAMRGSPGALARLVRRSGGRLTPALIGQAARAGDLAARRLWAQIGQLLGVGVANLINLCNPDRVVIGGGIANEWRWLFPSLARTVRAQALPASRQAVRIVRARLGIRAGIVGGAVLVWQTTNGQARSVRQGR